MVNYGRSAGCKTCKRRRVKCDEAKPKCLQCQRLGYQCEGYDEWSHRLRYQVPTSMGGGTQQQDIRIRTRRDLSATPTTLERPHLISVPSSSDNPQNTAVSLFLSHVVALGRSLDSTRGLLEMLTFVRPARERLDSPLALALNATAMQFYSIVRDVPSPSASKELLTTAYTRLRAAVQDPVERSDDGTILAVLLLQRYERVSAVWNRHKPCYLHRDGALALLRQQRLDSISSRHRGYLISQLVHFEVTRSIYKRIPFPLGELAWFRNQDLYSIPSNPNSRLDAIGVAVAHHQHEFYLLFPETCTNAATVPEALQWLKSIRDTEDQLRQWPDSLPNSWLPQKVKVMDDSTITYAGECVVYPNVQVAAIWNTWRIYSLILLQIRLALLDSLPRLESNQLIDAPFKHSAKLTDKDRLKRLVLNLVDAVCHSVPFHLGNQSKRVSLSDLYGLTYGSPFVFPSYYDLGPDHPSYRQYMTSSFYMSRDDHCRHVVVQGAFSIMSTLSHILELLANMNYRLLADALRPSQLDWIRGQFLRALSLLRLYPEMFGREKNRVEKDLDMDLAEAEILARRVREAWVG